MSFGWLSSGTVVSLTLGVGLVFGAGVHASVEPPGEPVTIYQEIPQVGPVAAAPDGVLYMIGSRSTLFRIPPTGSVEALRPSWFISTVAVHPSYGILYGQGGQEIWHASPDAATRELFARAPYAPGGVSSIAVDPEGDVWVRAGAPDRAGLLLRYDAYGTEKQRFGGTSEAPLPDWVFFAPDGTVHGKVGRSTLVRLEEETFLPVFSGGDSLIIERAVFDADGRIFAGTLSCQRAGVCSIPARGVLLLDPDYRIIADPFALEGRGSWGLAFLRDENGESTRRLVMVSSDPATGTGYVYEADPGALPTVGVQFSGRALRIDTDRLGRAMVGIPYADTLAAEVEATWTVDPRWPLVAGLTLSEGGVVTGIPRKPGNYGISVIARAGERSGRRLLRIQVDDPSPGAAALALLAGDTSEADSVFVRYLDEHGNRNGAYDVGDLRALITDP